MEQKTNLNVKLMIQNTFDVFNELNLKKICEAIAGFANEQFDHILLKMSQSNQSGSQISKMPESDDLPINRKGTTNSAKVDTMQNKEQSENSLKPDIFKKIKGKVALGMKQPALIVSHAK